MNNNRCLFCNKIIPEGRQICSNCEKDLTLTSVTPENELCRKCLKKCKGDDCKSLKEYMRRVRGKLSQKTTKKDCIIKVSKKGGKK